MTLFRDLSLCWCSMFSLILFLILFESRLSRKATIALSLGFMLPLLGANVALLFIYGPVAMNTMMLLTCSLPSLIFFWCLSKHRNGRFFFTFFMADTMIMEVMYVTSIADFYLGNNYLVMVVSRVVLCPLLTWATWKWIRPVFADVQSNVKKGWYSFSTMALIFYILLNISMGYPTKITERPEYLPAFGLLLILMPIMYGNIFRTLRNQQQMHSLDEQENILRLQVDNMTARVEEFSAADAKFRVERHNFRHKMQTIAGLVENKQYDELYALVQEYSDTIRETRVIRYCDYPVIDAVLAAYLQRAENKGIRVTAAIAFPDGLSISETELATVFANAIENAINACEKLPQHERFIKVKVLAVPRLMIQISNSYDGNAELSPEGIPVTHEEGHGFGTRSIVAFCEKHNVMYEFIADGQVFALRMVLTEYQYETL